MRRELPSLLLVAFASISTASVARESAIAPAPKRADLGRRAATAPARSIGSPTDGKLEGAVALQSSPELRLRHANGANYGLPALVGMLERSAKRVSSRFAGATLHVGDLSRREGGEIAGHRSHESGRDADVAFLFVGPDGESVSPPVFMTVDSQGVALENRKYRFDDARNWALVEAWVSDPGARVEHIFVASRVKARLLAHARAKGTYLPVLHRAAMAMKQPSAGSIHDDHFHVRIACPARQGRTCIPAPTRAEPPTKPASFQRPSRAPRALVKPNKRRETTPR